jgi:nucleotide-binding universal stress UspA family protein
MTTHVLCPVDFSDGSRTALRYASVVAEYLHAKLTVLTVNDPLLVEAAQAAGRDDWPESEAYDELRRFCTESLSDHPPLELDVRVGSPAQEILSRGAELPAALIVMGAQGLTGLRKMFLGSVAERVLRETTVPVLVTPTDHHTPASFRDLATLVRRIVVPVDLTGASEGHVRIATAVGAAIGVPLLLLHAVEPLSMPMRWRDRLPSIDMERRGRAEAAMMRLRDTVTGPGAEAIVAVGEPAEEIAKASGVRGAGLIVMGLHASGTGRVGSVTYRVLSLARVPVLALPAAAVEGLLSLHPIHVVTPAGR